jgi:uncharacterized protein (DUF697 family)
MNKPALTINHFKTLIMHNIDRTVGEANYEYNNESYELNPESYEYQGEFGSNESEDEFLNELNGMSGESYESGEMMGEYNQEYGQQEYSQEGNFETHELSNEALEMEFATELLGVSNEAELEQFLGKLIKRGFSAAKKFANSAAGQAIGKVLKAAAKKALPLAGKALGTALGGPVGGMIGGKLASAATNLFELELEGLSNEDKEFELSRAFVRFANDAVRQAARSPFISRNPRLAVRTAVMNSARRFAPGLLRRRSSYGARPVNRYNTYNNYQDNFGFDGGGSSQQGSGSWYRQGNQIIINLE